MSLLSFFGLASREESLSGDPFDDRWYKVDSGTGYAYLHPNAAGVHVNERTAMTYSACWAATMLLCSAISMIPLKLFRKLPGGGSEPAMDDPRYSLVHDTPNQDMTSMMFRSSRTAQQVNWGNAYAEIQRDRGGRPIALLPIHASRIPPESNIKRGSDGRLKYKINNDKGQSRELSIENILHIPSPMSDDGVVGKGVVEAARRSIGLGIASETHGSSYFSNGARPGIIIKGGKFKKKEDIDEFRRQWAEIHGGGPGNHAKPAILPPDTDVTALQFNAQDSQFLETRQFSIDDIARWYGVPPHTIGSLLRATNNNIEQLALELTKYTLMRWTVPQEQEMNRKLLTKEEQKTLYFLHVFEGLERADLATRTAALQQQFFNGALTLNQWMELENRRPIGPMGDLHFVQSAMVPLEVAVNGPPQPATTAEEGPTKGDETRQSMETYGIAVRAGSITPQIDDEEQYRKDLGLPPMSEEAKEAWEQDKGVRRPITLVPSGGKPASPFQQPPSEKPKEPAVDEDDESVDDGLAAMIQANEQLQAELARTKETQRRIANAMLRDVMGRMLSVEIHSVKHIAEKPNRFDARLREFYAKHKVTMERSLKEPILAVLTADKREPAADYAVGKFTDEHIAESLKQLDALCDCTADELSARVDQCLSTWHDERATVTV